jgi:hypothetical protein
MLYFLSPCGWGCCPTTHHEQDIKGLQMLLSVRPEVSKDERRLSPSFLAGTVTRPTSTCCRAPNILFVHGSIPLRRAQGGEPGRTAHHERKIEVGAVADPTKTSRATRNVQIQMSNECQISKVKVQNIGNWAFELDLTFEIWALTFPNQSP